MKQVAIVIVVLVILISSTLSSFGSTEELVGMVESKSFWTGFDWRNYEDTDLYKSVSWSRMPPEVTRDNRSYDYTTPTFEIIDIGATFIHMSVVLPEKNVLRIALFGTLSQDDRLYKKFVNWCDEKYGNNHIERKRDWVEGKGRREIFTTTWELGNTRVQVILDRDSTSGENQPRCFTQLGFFPTLSG